MRKKRILAAVIAVSMIFQSTSTIPASTISAYADDVAVESTEIETDTTDDELLVEDTASEENTDENITQEEAVVISELEEANEDAARPELIVGTSKKAILTQGEIVSELDGLYILSFSSIEERDFAYEYYQTVADIVDYNDATFEQNDLEESSEETEAEVETEEESVTENTETTEETSTELTTDGNTDTESETTESTEETKSSENPEEANAFDIYAQLDELDTEEANVDENKDIIAVIDSGSNNSENIISAVSMIDDDPTDTFGHGSVVIDKIIEQNPNAQILSIKALDENGKAKTADIYASIRYAIDNGATIINLSLSAYSTNDNSIIKDIIEEAQEKGIVVVASAGNKNIDAKYFVPANIESIYTIGSCGMNAYISNNSNFGEVVDYYVPMSNSTSEAAATFTGLYSANHTITSNISHDIASPFFDYAVVPDTSGAIANYILDDGEFNSNMGSSITVYSTKRDAGDQDVIMYNNGNYGTNQTQVISTAPIGYDSSSGRIEGNPNIYCVSPSLTGPINGSTNTTSSVSNANVRKILYYSFGYPGFSSAKAHFNNVYPAFPFGHQGCDDYYYVMSHMICTYAMYQASGGSSTYNWLATAGGTSWTQVRKDAITNLYNAIINQLPAPPATFKVYELRNSGSPDSYQHLIVGEMDTQYLRIAKRAKKGNTDITDNIYETTTSPYSTLKGAYFGIYATKADAQKDTNRLCTLVEDDDTDNITTSWSVPAGYFDTDKTLYIVELIAPTSYLEDTKKTAYLRDETIHVVNISASEVANKKNITIGVPNTSAKNVLTNQVIVDYNIYNKISPTPIRLHKKIDPKYQTTTSTGAETPMACFRNNPNYDLTSPYTYDIYKSDKTTKIGTLKSGSGTTYTEVFDITNYRRISNGKYLDTTFYIKETKAPKGYRKSSEWIKIVVKGSATGTQTFDVFDEPIVTTLPTDLIKKSKDENKPIKGAIFRVIYYKAPGYGATYTTTGLYKDGSSFSRYSTGYLTEHPNAVPKTSGDYYGFANLWFYQTNSAGKIDFDNDDARIKDKGGTPSSYKDNDGKIFFPLGVYVIAEESVPSTENVLPRGTFEYNDKSGTARKFKFDNTDTNGTNNSYFNLDGIVWRAVEDNDQLKIIGSITKNVLVEGSDNDTNRVKNITVKDEEKKPYYIGFKKTDINGIELAGIPVLFRYKDNDTNKTVTVWPEVDSTNKKQLNGAMTGYVTRKNDDGKYVISKRVYNPATGSNINTGITVIELGEFDKAPTDIQVVEKWYQPGTTATHDFVNQLAEDYTGSWTRITQSGHSFALGEAIACYKGKLVSINGTPWVSGNSYLLKTTTSLNLNTKDLYTGDSETAVINEMLADENNGNIIEMTNIPAIAAAKIRKTDSNFAPKKAWFEIYGLPVNQDASVLTSDIDKWNATPVGTTPSGLSCTKISTIQNNKPYLATDTSGSGGSYTDEDDTTTVEKQYTEMVTDAETGELLINLTNWYSTTATGKYKAFYAVEHSVEGTDTVITTRAKQLNIKVLTNNDVAALDSDGDVSAYTTENILAYLNALMSSVTVDWINPNTIHLYLTKSSSDKNAQNNPNYTLDGTTFKLFDSQSAANSALAQNNYSSALATLPVHKNADNDYVTDTQEVTNWMTDADGDGHLDDKTFWVVESATGRGFKKATTAYPITVTELNTIDNPATIDIENEPIDDPFAITIEKRDRNGNLVDEHLLPAGKTFVGTQFRVTYYAEDITNVYSYNTLKNDKDPSDAQTLTVAANGQTFTVNETGRYPLGYITVDEISTPAGYDTDSVKLLLLNKRTGNTIDITNNPVFILDNNDKVYYPNGATTYSALSTQGIELTTGPLGTAPEIEIIALNKPERGDLTIHKVDYKTNRDLSGIQFKVTNKETGEYVTLTTNSQGIATTEGNSAYWFKKSNINGTDYPYDSELRNLPFGTYTITELMNDANKNYQILAPFDVTINQNENKVVGEYQGTLYNVELPEITTQSTVVETNSKQLPYMTSSATITDTIHYDYLRRGTKYTLVGTLMVKKPNGDIEPYEKNGSVYKVMQEFTTSSTTTKSEFECSGNVSMSFDVTMNESYAGCDFVVYQKLYLGSKTEVPTNDANAKQYTEYANSDRKIFPVLHEKIASPEQTVYVPSVKTEAITENGTQYTDANGTHTITDTVTCTNLIVGKSYRIEGSITLSDGTKVNGQTISSEPTTFTATKTTETKPVTFNNVNTAGLDGKSLVVHEKLYMGSTLVAQHSDLNDPKQTITLSSIETDVTDNATNSQVGKNGIIQMTDTVLCRGLEVGQKYRIEGILMNASVSPAVALKDSSNKTYTSFKEFTVPANFDGKVTIPYEIDASHMDGKTIVVYEKLYRVNNDGTKEELATHENAEDRRQWIHIPLIETQLKDDATNKQIIQYRETANLTDTVTCHNLVAGLEYKATGELKTSDGTSIGITDETTFTVGSNETETKAVSLQYELNVDQYAGKTIVAFAKLYVKNKSNEWIEVADHTNINAPTQRIEIPDVKTQAITENGSQYTDANGTHTITDSVTCTNLVVGKSYTIKGNITLSDGTNPNNQTVTAEPVTFTATKTTETVPVPFNNVNTKGLDGKRMVVHEELYTENILVGKHSDLNDPKQTITLASIETDVTDNATNSQIGKNGTIRMTDTVICRGLETGKKYCIEGILMDTSKTPAEEIKDATGNSITSSVPFTVNADFAGTVGVPYEVDASHMDGKTIVVYEKLYRIKDDGTKEQLAIHEDETDTRQWMHIASVETQLTDDTTNEHVAKYSKATNLTDTITCHNLIEGLEYKVVGELKTSDGATINATDEEEFTVSNTETETKTVNLNYTIDAKNYSGKTIVAFARVYVKNANNEWVEIADHTDINAPTQKVVMPTVETEALTDVGTHYLLPEGTHEITDTVTCKNLLPGKSYTTKAYLMLKPYDTSSLSKDDNDDYVLEPATNNGNAIVETKTFDADSTTKTVEVTFTVDASQLIGKQMVVYEELLYNDEVVAVHKDPTSDEQSIFAVTIKTHAKDAATNIQMASNGQIQIVDTVDYIGTVPGATYTMKGQLMNLDGTPVQRLDENGEPITEGTDAEKYYLSEKEFTADKVEDKVDMTYDVDATFMDGRSVVVFEELYDSKGNKLAFHTEADDEAQMTHMAKIETSASDKDTGIKLVTHDDEATIIDTVSYHNVLPNVEYYIGGNIHIKGSNEIVAEIKPEDNAFVAEGTPAAGSHTVDGRQDVNFIFNSTVKDLEGKTLVVYEKLYVKNGNKFIEIAHHTDENDINQTVQIPKVRTLALADTLLHFVEADGMHEFTDTVSYENLIPNKNYVVEGVLMYKSDDAELNETPVLKADGNAYDGSTEFTANETGKGTVDVYYNVDTSLLAGKHIVAYENLYYIKENGEKVLVAKHCDINDKEQTYFIVDVQTLAIDDKTNINIASNETTTITDSVSCIGLDKNTNYIIKGVLMDTSKLEGTTKLSSADGIFYTGESEVFNSGDKTEMTVPVKYEIDAKLFKNKTTTVYEKLFVVNDDGTETEIAKHENIGDTKQMIHVPDIATLATDDTTKIHLATYGEEITVTDIVSYNNLLPNVEYTLKGELMEIVTKEDGSREEVATGITAEEKFTPSVEEKGNVIINQTNVSVDGTHELTFKFDSTKYANSTFVVYERLYVTNTKTEELTEIADHTDIADEKQTIYIAKITTKAEDSVSKTNLGELRSNIEMDDTVAYSNVIPGEYYQAKGILMDKSTGKPFLDKNGKEVTATSNVFKPSETSGEINVHYNFDIDIESIDKNTLDLTLVVFEELYLLNDSTATSTDATEENTPVNDEQQNGETEEAPALDNETETNGAEDVNATPEQTETIGDTDVATSTDATEPTDGTETNTTDKTDTVEIIEDASNLKEVALVAVHKDIEDEGQTVRFTSIRTTLTADAEKEIHEAKADEKVVLKDYVYYHNLVIDKEYTISGTLMKKPKSADQTPEPVLDENNKPITSSITFTAKEPTGFAELEFTVNGASLIGETVVAFEDLYYEQTYLCSHADITDEAQSVHFPKIGTKAFSSDTDLQTAPVNDKITIVDEVSFENLLYGKTYVMTGTLINKVTGKPMLDANNKPIVAAQEFTVTKDSDTCEITTIYNNDSSIATNVATPTDEPRVSDEPAVIEDKQSEIATSTDAIPEDSNISNTEATTDTNATTDTENTNKNTVSKNIAPAYASGTVKVTFKDINSLNLAGVNAVVFETCTNKETEKEVADHKDVEDKDQSIDFPEVHTKAKDKADGDKALDYVETTQTIIDTVSYTNLVVGKTYKVKGCVAVKPANKDDKVEMVKDKNGNIVYAEVEFTAEKPDGEIEVPITIDISKYTNNHLVVFEDLYYNDILLYSHADINDDDQTVFVGMQLQVEIVKADKDNKERTLSGAEITIYTKDGKIAKDVAGKDCVGVTDKNGKLTFNVAYDKDITYYAQETKAPDGYKLNKEKFELKPTGNKNEFGADVIKVTILDEKNPPPTAKTGDFILITFGIITLIGLAGLFFFRKKKKIQD